MYVLEYKFYPDTKKIRIEDYLIDLWSYSAELMTSGQIADYTTILNHKIPRQIIVSHERNSLSSRFHTTIALKAYKEILDKSDRKPSIKILGTAPEAGPVCHCKRPSSVYFLTTYFSYESPLRCGQCKRPIPIYRFKLTRERLLGIKLWKEAHNRCDGLFVGSGVGEHWGHKQVASFSSRLSKDAYELCRNIEKEIKIPTYYYLNKYYGRSKKDEKRRKCPKCGGKWLLEKPWHDYFHFKCYRCKLISNIAWDV